MAEPTVQPRAGRGDPREPLIGSLVVVGVGCHDRTDDAAGPLVVEEFARRRPAVRTVVRAGDLAVLPMCWNVGDDVVIVGTIASLRNGPTHHLVRLEADDLAMPPLMGSHSIGLADALRLADIVGNRPGRLRLVGVTGHRFEPGPPPPALIEAIPQLVDQLASMIDG